MFIPLVIFLFIFVIIQCVKCPAGWSTENTEQEDTAFSDKCVRCESGKSTKTSLGVPQCTTCSAGSYRMAEEIECSLCDAHTYSDQSGQISCKNCDVEEKSDSGSTFCVKCDAGKHMNTETDGDKSCRTWYVLLFFTLYQLCIVVFEMINIDVFLFINFLSLSFFSFHISPSGFVSIYGQAKCKVCIAGKYGNTETTETLPANTECQDCSAGLYSAEVGAFHIDVCIGCPQGRYSSTLGLSSKEKCNACPPGRKSIEIGTDSEDACTKCEPGSKSTSGVAECEVCKAGQKTNDDSTACDNCDLGMFGQSENLVSEW